MPAKYCTTFYLEMLSAEQLRAKPIPQALNLIESCIPQFEVNRFLYEWTGKPWGWDDLDHYTDNQWEELVNSDSHRTWLALYDGAIAGYYELHRTNQAEIELMSFALTPHFIGAGLGGPLLSHATHAAWAWGGTWRIWLTTCTKDHHNALRNYLARGYQIYKEEVDRVD